MRCRSPGDWMRSRFLPPADGPYAEYDARFGGTTLPLFRKVVAVLETVKDQVSAKAAADTLNGCLLENFFHCVQDEETAPGEMTKPERIVLKERARDAFGAEMEATRKSFANELDRVQALPEAAAIILPLFEGF